MPQHASFQNMMAHNTAPLEPEVGMGATYIGWSDRHACTIIEVKSPVRLVIQRDIATRSDTDGRSDSQSYTFAPDPEGQTYVVTKRKDGRWKVQGSQTTVMIGWRSEYYDYSF